MGLRISGLALIGVLLIFGAALASPAQAQSSKSQIVSHFKSRWKPFSPNTKIFLVAGSSQTGNFTQEILDQRRLWLSRGFQEDEIACYYVAPTRGEYHRDHEQYLELALWLPDCFPASTQLIREHLLTVAKQKPPFLYIYITTHGKRPISEDLEITGNLGRNYEFLRDRAQYPVLDQYRLIIEALPTGPASERELLEAYRKGKSSRDLYLTPQYLRETLAEFPKETPKFLVLQACFSGGFIQDTKKSTSQPALTELPQITIMTAARYDRSSFGCHAGPKTTYFGGVFNEELAKTSQTPPQIDWLTLYQHIQDKVSALEAEHWEYAPSLPAFFTNFIR